MYSLLRAIWHRIKRKKHVDSSDTKTELVRCLSLRRLTFIGIGKTVGVGIYVLIGVATKEYAGPSIVLSFLIGFLVTLLNGLCFAEYASRNPRTGAQYTYMYETLGEGMAFLVGWTSILSIISACSLASRGWSGYVDSMFNHAIQNFTVNHVANWTLGSPFPSYPDFPAIFIVIIVTIMLGVGVNFSTLVNSILTGVSGGILIFITLFGLYYADIKNWFNDHGGFFPYGLRGVLKASSACFYAFQGFEILGLSAEEAVNPVRNIPLAIVLTLVIVTLLYLGVAVSFTLMIPYTAVNTNAPFPGAFQYNSVTWAKYLVAIGPIFALANLCSLELFTLQRFAYSMSSDGLLFSFLSKVNKRSKVPIGPLFAFGPIVIGLVLCIDLSNLIGFMVTYTFLQYSLFSAYMIVLRYEAPSGQAVNITNKGGNCTNKGHNSTMEVIVRNTNNGIVTSFKPSDDIDNTDSNDSRSCQFVIDRMSADADIGTTSNRQDLQDGYFDGESQHTESNDLQVRYIDEESQHIELNENGNLLVDNNKDSIEDDLERTCEKMDNRNSLQLIIYNILMSCGVVRNVRISQLVILIYVTCFLLAIQLIQGSEDVLSGQWLALVVTCVLTTVIILCVLGIWCQEQKGTSEGFLIPLMPFSPVACLFFNMMMLASIAEKGSLLASFTLAAVGIVVYLCMVVCDIYKGDKHGGSVSYNKGEMEYVSLLTQDEESGQAEGQEEDEEVWN